MLISGDQCSKLHLLTQRVPPVKGNVGVFLAKADDELISHCKCDHTFIGAPGQMDCPWCGCGWLFLCPKCRKAFAFARAVECNLSWEELAHNDLGGKYGRQPDPEEVDEWIAFMKMMTKNLELGKRYVYIDGWVFPTDQRYLQFDGFHAHHDLPEIPQVAALRQREFLDDTLGNREYWRERTIGHG